jgi:hypothetical protein
LFSSGIRRIAVIVEYDQCHFFSYRPPLNLLWVFTGLVGIKKQGWIFIRPSIYLPGAGVFLTGVKQYCMEPHVFLPELYHAH